MNKKQFVFPAIISLLILISFYIAPPVVQGEEVLPFPTSDQNGTPFPASNENPLADARIDITNSCTTNADGSYTCQISSQTGWQQIPLTLATDDAFDVAYIGGTWTVDVRNYPYVDANGYSSTTPILKGCEFVNSLPYGRLLGYHGATFSIGTGGWFSAQANTPLFVRINDLDECLVDNDGIVEIKVIGPPAKPFNLQPSNISIPFGQSVTLSWQADASADTCNVQVYNPDNTLANESGKITARSYNIGAPSSGSHRWQVECYNSQGLWSGWVSANFTSVNVEPVILIPGIGGSQLTHKISLIPVNIWPFGLDKSLLSLKPGSRDDSIYTDDAIRGLPGVPRIYASIIAALEQADYVEYKTGNDPAKRLPGNCATDQENATLFIFPWDWRYGVVDVDDIHLNLSPNNVNLLAGFIKCIEMIHPGAKVNIVAHSMGGLLARKYIVEHAAEKRVHRLITIDTPWLGAPKAIAMMLNGDFMPCLYEKPQDGNIFCIRKDTTISLLEYFPGAHQLLPSRQYYDLISSTDQYPLLGLEGGFPIPYKSVQVPYSIFNQKLQRYYVSPAEGESHFTSVDFMGNNEKLFDKPEFSDWTNDKTDVQYFVITGEKKVKDTISKVKRTLYSTWYGEIKFFYDLDYTYGDGTVPAESQNRLGNGKDFNGPSKLLPFFQKNDSESMEHGDMPSNTRVQECILNILQNTPCVPHQVEASADVPQAVRYLRIWGAQSLQVSDVVSMTTNLLTITQSLSIFPHITMNYLGDDAAILIIADDQTYTVTMKSKQSLLIKSSFGAGSDILHYQSFEPHVQNDQIVSLVSAPNSAHLSVDTDGNGIPETDTAPSSDLTGEVANDNTRPVITSKYDPMTELVTISATDSGSGIKQVRCSLDEVFFSECTQPVTVDLKKTPYFYLLAEDAAGNWSDIFQATAIYPIYLPVIHG